MIVQIHGAGFQNKGAHLMLLTVLRRLRCEAPDICCCMAPAADAPFEARSRCSLYTLLPQFSTYHRRWYLHPALRAARAACSMLPRSYCQSYGLVRRQDTGALIDISGYAYGDKWTIDKFMWLIELAEDYRRRGRPVILLPQMLGPFTRPGYAALFRRIMALADLVYARDRISFECAKSAGGKTDRLRLAPDITIFSDPAGAQPRQAGATDRVCIVPNARMLERCGAQSGSDYLDLLFRAGQRILSRGLSVSVLLHDHGADDLRLARELSWRLGEDRCLLCSDEDPMRLKAFIAASRFIISSRFHSIVAALSTGVPAIMLGWAHKYEMLASDFQVPELVHRDETTPAELDLLVDRLIDDGEVLRYRERLLNAKRCMYGRHTEMWQEVFLAMASQGKEPLQPKGVVGSRAGRGASGIIDSDD